MVTILLLLGKASSGAANSSSVVNGNWQDNSALSSLVAQIRHSFSDFPGVSFQYLPRQLNTSAHFLAKEAIRLREDAHEDSDKMFFQNMFDSEKHLGNTLQITNSSSLPEV
ncbi:hypothetical protein F8388_016615 [Cannabis sativa]|uniref:RNase H type-1 domain-containing protein n=1 Tax=Cannabis sativa TaxID=3483 RepID=A0A7J6FAT5_CANSA|nr:hypothetical protein F8388_016615 [Cannabis sativa]